MAHYIDCANVTNQGTHMNQHVKFVAVAAALAAMLTLIVAESVYAQAPVKLAGASSRSLMILTRFKSAKPALTPSA